MSLKVEIVKQNRTGWDGKTPAERKITMKAERYETMEKLACGYYNGKPYYTESEYKQAIRHHGEFTSDADLLAFAEKVTSNWYDAGWHRTFETFYLSDYACAEPRSSLTKAEFDRLVEMQREARAAAKAADDARCWRKVDTIYWADNSEEEIWEDKDGIRKTVMTVGPHGDVC